MASNAGFSNASLTHRRHLWKSSFTAINRSGSSSSESKGGKKGVLDSKWHPAGYDRLDPPDCPGTHCPVCSCFLGPIFSLSERLFSASVHTRVYLPLWQSEFPREAGRKPRTTGNPGGWRRNFFSSL